MQPSVVFWKLQFLRNKSVTVYLSSGNQKISNLKGREICLVTVEAFVALMAFPIDPIDNGGDLFIVILSQSFFL